jgi:hypothetical protein
MRRARARRRGLRRSRSARSWRWPASGPRASRFRSAIGAPAISPARRCDADHSHRITFHFTPKHASWLNQIEIWFSILVRKLIRRESFASKADLKARIERFIAYFNQTMAKPFKWTWAGKPLTV